MKSLLHARPVICALGIYALGAMGTSAYAQAEGSEASVAEETLSVGEIIVTASKREQSINKVGAPITAMSGDALQERTVVSAADLASVVPGLNYSPTDTGSTVFTLRGVGYTDSTLSAYPDVTVYLDQVPLPFPLIAGLANFDVSRVEVLKGPQGTLFGANATGGAINYIANKPTSHLSGGVTLNYGRFNDLMVDANISGPLSQDLLFRVAGRVHQSDDWQYSYTRDDTTARTSNWALRTLLNWTPTDRLTFDLNVNGWQDKSTYQQPQFFEFDIKFPFAAQPYELNYPTAPNNARAADWVQHLPLRNNTWLFQASLQTRYMLTDDITLTSLSSYIHAKQDAVPQQGGANFENSVYGSNGTFDDYFQELRLDNGSAGTFRWTLGLNYAQDDVSEGHQAWFAENSAGIVLSTSGDKSSLDQDTKNYAAFGAVEYDVGDYITLKGGLRYTETKRVGYACTIDPGDGTLNALFNLLQSKVLQQGDCISINPATGMSEPVSGTIKEDNLSYRAGIDFKVARDVLLYVNTSRGYKAGGFPSVDASTTLQYLPVKQESVTNYEGGIKARLFDRKVLFNGAVFYYKYKDKQLRSKIIDPVYGALTNTVNVPKSHIFGLEAELSTAPLDGFSFNLSGTYLDAKIDEFVGVNAGGIAGDFAGTRMPFAPKFSINAGIGYETPITDNLKLNLAADLAYRSKTNVLVGGTPSFDLPSYTTLDLRAGVETEDGKWKAFIYGKNVTNEFYLTNVVQQYDLNNRITGMPVTYGISISRKF
ncbi:TonB-dependent receptor [Sphingobium fuliginis]|nr:TonB-dependent receptor [Sphingobium fuliginis]